MKRVSFPVNHRSAVWPSTDVFNRMCSSPCFTSPVLFRFPLRISSATGVPTFLPAVFTFRVSAKSTMEKPCSYHCWLTLSGQACPELYQERRCLLTSCDADCVVSEWSEWSPCGAPCGGGQQTRQRHVLSVPVGEGEPCPDLVHSRSCNTFSCDGGCEVGQWREWGECSKPCEGGTKTRTRDVRPLEDGADCPPSSQTAPCNLHDCGEWRSESSSLHAVRSFERISVLRDPL